MAFLKWLLIASALWLGGRAVQASGAEGHPADESRAYDLADSLFRQGRSDSALTLLRPAIVSARTRGDRPLLLRLRLREGGIAVLAGYSRAAEPGLREALLLARALGDSAAVARALRWLVGSLSDQGRTEEIVPLCHRLLDLSPELKDRQYAGHGWLGLAYHDLVSGRAREARSGYEKAVAEFRSVDQPYWELWAMAGLGRALGQLDEFQAEHDCYARMASRARDLKLHPLEATALNNLGVWEFLHGDPGAAADCYRRASGVHRTTGNLRECVVALQNVAIVETYLGWYDAASAAMDTVIAICFEQGYGSETAAALEQLGTIRSLQSRAAEAAALFRRVPLLVPEPPPEESVEAAIGLSEALARMDSTEAGLAALLEYGARADQAPVETRILFDLELGERLVELNRWKEALVHLLEVDREAGRLFMSGRRMRPLTLAARCYSALGRPDSAVALLHRAEAVWESGREMPVDPEWREVIGSQARDLFALLIELNLDSHGAPVEDARAGRAFDRLQRFKARTLRERMRGPVAVSGASAESLSAPITLSEVQSALLRDDEILIDSFIGPERSFLFAVTRTGIRGVTLEGGEADLVSRLTLYRDIVSAPPRGNSTESGALALQRTNEVLGNLLLGPVADLLRRHHRVVFVSDAAFNLVPLAWLPLPPETDGGPWEPMALGREVTFVPSAAILADCRRRTASTSPIGRILAFAGRTGDGNQPLPGAVREAAWLSDRFPSVDVRLDSLSEAEISPGEALCGYGVLHLAAHTSLDNQRPWRSGIRVVSGPAATRDAYLRAADISRLNLGARLAVLSGCESAGGRILPGEGVLGLTGAFLAAGVPSVVATLWPVDDRVTERFTRHFYRSLARGKSLAVALRDAQISLRNDRSTRDPFYWAAFVVVGDGSGSIPLTQRFAWGALLPAGLALMAAALLVVSWTRRPRRATTRRKSL